LERGIGCNNQKNIKIAAKFLSHHFFKFIEVLIRDFNGNKHLGERFNKVKGRKLVLEIEF
jgi:ribosomal protein S17E